MDICFKCKKPLGYWKALIGNEFECESRLFKSAPLHEDCVKVFIQEVKRIWGENKSPHLKIGMFITRSVEARLIEIEFGRPTMIYRGAPAARIEWLIDD